MDYFFGFLTAGFGLALLVEIFNKPRTQFIIVSSILTIASAGGLAYVLIN